jgi:hypothetical protein
MKVRRIVGLYGVLGLLPLLWNGCARAQVVAAPLSDVEFHSSNASLNESFLWAKRQALSYGRTGSDSIGPWYEAALPVRNAFACAMFRTRRKARRYLASSK